MALDPAILDELYQLATQYQAPASFMNMPFTPIGSDPDLEGGGSPFGQIGHASTPFGDQYFGPTSYSGPGWCRRPTATSSMARPRLPAPSSATSRRRTRRRPR